MREPNAIDFWRGLALVTIFINHVPGNTFERYTYSQYGISDAAELFVFLAGWSIGIATRGRDGAPVDPLDELGPTDSGEEPSFVRHDTRPGPTNG